MRRSQPRCLRVGSPGGAKYEGGRRRVKRCPRYGPLCVQGSDEIDRIRALPLTSLTGLAAMACWIGAYPFGLGVPGVDAKPELVRSM